MARTNRYGQTLIAITVVALTVATDAAVLAAKPVSKAQGVVQLKSGERLVWNARQVQLVETNGHWDTPVSWPHTLVWGVWPHGEHNAAVVVGSSRPGTQADEVIGIEIAGGKLIVRFRIPSDGRFIDAVADTETTWILNSEGLHKLLAAGSMLKVADHRNGELYVLPWGISLWRKAFHRSLCFETSCAMPSANFMGV